ncbi:MAG: YgaP family membrane protein [Candidatus Acidulodesulfobacterium sp.]
MKTNESGTDRVIRVILGIVLIVVGALALKGAEVLGIILIIVGLIALITGLTGFCALYTLLGINTCKKCEK